MVSDIVHAVLSDNSNRRVTETIDPPASEKKKNNKSTTEKQPRKGSATGKARTKEAVSKKEIKEGDICPLCGKGHIIRGKTAFGCSEWKNGCSFRQEFKP